MEVVPNNTLLPGDPRLIEHIVCELKSQGIFDQFRKECIDDVDTKPAYQNLRQRVEGSVSGFLKTQAWRPDMNKNQLREMLRKNIYESGFLETGVERIVDQVVYPKINSVFLPQVEDVVYNFLGLEKPIRTISTINGPLTINTIDLLPTDLDPISPDSEVMDKSLNKSDKSNDETDKLDDSKNDEFESPPFEPITEQSVFSAHDEDSSNDSHLSGISGLTSHDSNMSSQDSKLNIFSLDVANQDSQLSKVSSNSRLSIIITDSKHNSEKMDISDDSETSKSSKLDDESNLNAEETSPDKSEESDVSHFNIKPEITDESEINEHENGESEAMKDEEQCEVEMDIDEDSQMSNIEEQKTREEETTLEDESIAEEINKESLEKEMEELKMNVHGADELAKEFCEETKSVVSLEENISKEIEENGSKSGVDDQKTEDSRESISKCDLKTEDTSEREADLKKQEASDDGLKIEVKKSESSDDGSKLEVKKSERSRHDSDRRHSSKSESKDKKDDRKSDKDRKEKDRNRSTSSSKDKDKYRDKSKDNRSKDKDTSRSKDDKNSKPRDDKESSKSSSKDDKSRSSSSSKSSRDRSNSKSDSKSTKDSKDRSDSRSKPSTNSKSKDDKAKNEENKVTKSDDTKKSDSSKKPEDSKKESDLKKSSKSEDSKSSSKSEENKSSRSRDRSRSDSKQHTSNSSSRDRKSSSSKDHKEGKKDPKKSSKRDKDDHSSSRDKKTDNRRSADRDSNDGSSGIGNNSNSNSSKEKESSSVKSSENSTDSSQGTNSGDSGQSDNSQTSQCLLNPIDDSAAMKTSVTILTETLRDKHEIAINSPAKDSDAQPLKIMKPKFASNIFEARRLMKVRKKLEKLEKKRQRQLVQGNMDKEVDCLSLEDTDSVDSGCLQIVEQEEMKEDLEFTNTPTDRVTLRDDSNSTPTTSVVSKESWDALEAKLSLNVDYDSYIDESSSSTKYPRRSSDEEDCLYFVQQPSPKIERYLKRVASLQRDSAQLAIVLEDCRKMAPPHRNSDVPAKRARKINQKYMIDEVESSETITSKKTKVEGKTLKKTKGRKRKFDSEMDGFYLDNNNKKTNHHFDVTDIVEDYEEVMEPSPSASNTSNGSIDLTTKIKPPTRSKKAKKIHNETFPLPLSPESDVSASSIEVRNVAQEKDVAAPVKTPRASIKKSQRYSSDDLYKPRPFVSGSSRRQRGLLNSTDNVDPSAKLRR